MVYLKFSAPPSKSVPAPHRKFVIRNLLQFIIRHLLKLLFDQSIKMYYQFIEIDYPIYGRFVHWATRVTAGHGGCAHAGEWMCIERAPRLSARRRALLTAQKSPHLSPHGRRRR